MGKVETFKDLIAWQKAIALAKILYEATTDFPPAEQYGIVSQIRRAAVSISTNLAEGHGRHGTVDYLRFLRIARGSATESESLWILAHELRFICRPKFERTHEKILEEIRILDSLIRKLRLRVNQKT